jgi:hypothetical protein
MNDGHSSFISVLLSRSPSLKYFGCRLLEHQFAKCVPSLLSFVATDHQSSVDSHQIIE